MILSDGTIRRLRSEGRLAIEPYSEAQLQPASYDVILGPELLVGMYAHAGEIDPRERNSGVSWYRKTISRGGYLLKPGEFILGATAERLTLADDLVARVEGKSSLGRLGLLVHVTAGFVDPGWADGRITLELKNLSPLPIRIYAGMKIGQLSFAYLDCPAERPYGSAGLGSHYQGQDGPEASRYRL
jgi:dCTP deaminase